MFLACSARSSNLRLLPEFFAVPFVKIASTKSPEQRVPAYGEQNGKEDRKKIALLDGKWDRGRKKKKEEKR